MIIFLVGNKFEHAGVKRMDFASRLKQLLEEKKVTQKALAEYLGITRQAVSQYVLGTTKPNADVIAAIARFFSVSADYLLGISPIQTQDITTKEMCAQLGLSEWNIKSLKNAVKYKDETILDFLNEILYRLPYSYLIQEYSILQQIREKGIEHQENDTRGSTFEQDSNGHWYVSMFGGTAARVLAQEIGKEIGDWLLDTKTWDEKLKEIEEKVEWVRILSENLKNQEE